MSSFLPTECLIISNFETVLQKVNNLRIVTIPVSQKLYKQIDWTKFKTEGEDDEEEE